jgi:putative hydrolase of the HAD superfamily
VAVGNAIKVVSFDLWDTVLVDDSDEPKRAALGMLAKADDRRRLVFDFLSKHGPVSRSEIQDACATTDAAFRRVWYDQNVTWTVHERLSVLLQSLGRTLPDDEFGELVRLHEEMELEVMPELIPGIAEALDALEGRYRLAVISDTIFSPGRALRQILQHYLLHDIFEAFVFSDEVGCAKPDPRVFEAVLRETGCAPRELVHVGDREEKDIAGPHAVGARAILVQIVKDQGQGRPQNHGRRDLPGLQRAARDHRRVGGVSHGRGAQLRHHRRLQSRESGRARGGWDEAGLRPVRGDAQAGASPGPNRDHLTERPGCGDALGRGSLQMQRRPVDRM